MRTIFLTFLSIFSTYEDPYVNLLYIMFLYNFFLPDVASAAIASFTFVSLVPSVHVMLVEDAEATKDASGVFTKTLNLYCITHNTLPFLSHILYIWHVFIYMCNKYMNV